ncbi:MAG: hypothetical protein QOC94_4295 [Actinoplanes sp.]|jgi:hypothetical protein|nr:hypothetical protein [Actinoplanes sp.]
MRCGQKFSPLALGFFALMAAELVARRPQATEGQSGCAAFAGAAVITTPIAVHRRWPVAALNTPKGRRR